MKSKYSILITLPCIISIIVIMGYIINFYGSQIEYIIFRNNKIKCLNRHYFLTNRYKYKHVIGNYVINTDFGDIFIKTGDKILDHKGYLGTLFDVKNHTINILNNNINNIESIYIFFDDNFSIELEQDFNIFEKILKINYREPLKTSIFSIKSFCNKRNVISLIKNSQ